MLEPEFTGNADSTGISTCVFSGGIVIGFLFNEKKKDIEATSAFGALHNYI